MAYTPPYPNGWVNDPAAAPPKPGETPVTAEALDTIDQGILDAHEQLDGRLSEATLNSTYALAGASKRLPVLRIDTAGGADVTSKEVYLNCTYDVPGAGSYPGRIRGRGNYTWSLPKKPFRVKLDTAAPILGLPASKDFALIANHYADDPSMINTAVAMRFGAKCAGLDWTPKFAPCEVFLNGMYWGVYLLMENVQIDDGRVPKPKVSGTTGLGVTGTYLMEVDARAVMEGNPHLTTSRGLKIAYDDPDGSVPEHVAYITDFIQDFEDALYTDGANWRQYIDLDSFIDWYLVEELFSNQDSAFSSSCKIWKSRDTETEVGKLHMGPLWDFGISLGHAVNTAHPAQGWYTKSASWYTRLFAIPEFQAALKARWATFKPLVTGPGGLLSIIDSTALELSEAADRDQQRWGYSTTWAIESTTKRSWVRERVAWLDTQFSALGTTASIYPRTFPATFA